MKLVRRLRRTSTRARRSGARCAPPPSSQRGRVLVRPRGTLGALLGERVVEAGPGSWRVKPRGEWHTFWNAGDAECRIVEVISPGVFERYFRELADVFRDSGAAGPDPGRLGELAARYALGLDVVPALCRRFGLTHPLA